MVASAGGGDDVGRQTMRLSREIIVLDYGDERNDPYQEEEEGEEGGEDGRERNGEEEERHAVSHKLKKKRQHLIHPSYQTFSCPQLTCSSSSPSLPLSLIPAPPTPTPTPPPPRPPATATDYHALPVPWGPSSSVFSRSREEGTEQEFIGGDGQSCPTRSSVLG